MPVARGKARKRLWKISLYLMISATVLMVGFPFYWMGVTSITPDSQIFRMPPNLFPKSPDFSHYKRLFEVTRFFIYFKNSLIVTALVVILTITLSTLGAYSVTRFKYRGRKTLARTILFVYMFPPMLLAIPIFVIMAKIGMTNTYFSLVMAITARTLPFCLWLLWGFFRGIPLELEEAAMVDGNSRMGAFRRIVLPLALPGIAAAAIFAFELAWNNYTFAFILMTSEDMKTLPVGIASFAEAKAVEWGLVMSSTVMLCIPALIFFMLAQRHLIRGWGAGGVKG
jgi:multiple sugar transport system permease protein